MKILILLAPYKPLIRPLMLLVPVALAILGQTYFQWTWQWHSVNLAQMLIRAALMIMFFLISLQIKIASLKLRREHWKILLANVLIAVIPYWILNQLGFRELALVAFFTGISPTANAAPVIMDFLNGRVGLVLTGFVVTNLGIGLLLIGLLPWVTGQMSWSFVSDVLLQMLLIIGVPFSLATILRKIHPRSQAFPAKLKALNFYLWCFTLFIVSCVAVGYITKSEAPAWEIALIALMSLGVCIASFGIGAYISARKYRRECSQMLGQKNTSFTIFLALAFGGSSAAIVTLGPVFYIVFHNTWNAIQLFKHDRRRAQRLKLLDQN